MGPRVTLIGAGPGDPELLTLKAARALARIIEVGKRGGCKSTPQAFIEKLLILYAKERKNVVRLKGGDPFVFGRGGEEVEALRSQGIEVEVIPGITAGIAVPASLGIPVTHREFARGVTFLTGHTKDGTEPDWQALARSRTTLVIYMGLKGLEKILSSLTAAGLDPATPACIIENGTLHSQRERVATLGTLSGEGFAGPALIVIGEVVRFARAAAAAKVAKAA